MSLLGANIQVSRTSGAYDENGIWQVAFSTDDTIVATIQPVMGEEYQNLPEGRKQFGTIKIYTTADLKAFDQSTNSAGDIVIFDGRNWEVAQKLIFSSGLIPHKKYIAYLVVE
jgi:hypothetical protein